VTRGRLEKGGQKAERGKREEGVLEVEGRDRRHEGERRGRRSGAEEAEERVATTSGEAMPLYSSSNAEPNVFSPE